MSTKKSQQAGVRALRGGGSPNNRNGSASEGGAGVMQVDSVMEGAGSQDRMDDLEEGELCDAWIDSEADAKQGGKEHEPLAGVHSKPVDGARMTLRDWRRACNMVGDAAFQRSLGVRMIEPMPLGAVDSDGLTELSPELVRIVELAFLFKEQQNELAAASTVAATSANGAGASGSQRKLGGAKALEEAEALWLQYFAELPDHYDGTRWIALCNRSFVPPRPPENPSLGATLGYDGRYGRHEEHHAPQMVQMERPHMAFIPMLARLPEEEAWVQTKVDGWYYKVHGDPSLDFAWFTQFDWKRDFDSPGPGQCRLSRTLAKK
ncbi:hypothetical protein AURDEDRAFT_178585, partial [Auricularia subglabra TFB-10046 SS5]